MKARRSIVLSALTMVLALALSAGMPAGAATIQHGCNNPTHTGLLAQWSECSFQMRCPPLAEGCRLVVRATAGGTGIVFGQADVDGQLSGCVGLSWCEAVGTLALNPNELADVACRAQTYLAYAGVGQIPTGFDPHVACSAVLEVF